MTGAETMPWLEVIRVLVVLAGDRTDDAATTGAIEQALRSSLGADVVVSVRRGRDDGADTDAALAKEAVADEATLLGVVTWTEAHRDARIRFFRPTEPDWGSREIRFGTTDVASERGRTVGFALASMVPDEALSRREPERAAPAPAPAAEAPFGVPPSAETPGRTVFGRPGPTSFEIAGHGAIAVGGRGGGLGGAVAVRRALGSSLRLHFVLGGRVAEIDEAQATAHGYFLGGGIAWARPLGAERRWEIGARLDALVLAQDVVHLSSDDPGPDHRFRLLPGAAVAVEAAYRFIEPAAVVLALGAEAALGETSIVLHGYEAAKLVPFRPLAEAGVRVSF